MYVILLFLLASNVFTALFAMDDARHGLSFHQVVNAVEAGCDLEQAKEKIEELRVQGKDPNVVSDGKTAAQLSAYFCVERSSSFENQLGTLNILLSFDETGVSNFNKKEIGEYLNKESVAINLSLTGLKRRPFKKTTKTYRGGYFLEDDDDDDDEKRLNNQLDRVNRVRILVEEPE